MQPNIEKLQKLLDEVSEIKNQDKYKTEGYNVFSILKPNENMTSAFIADLLNSHGTHEQAGKFLDLFLDVLVEAKIIENKLAYQNMQVNTEVWIANESRLDILLQGTMGTIYIENKIKNYDNDQPMQIEKYHTSGIEGKNDVEKQIFKLLYLTPTGRKASSAGNLQAGKDYFCISYSEHIFKWIEKCIENVNSLQNPTLYQTLLQFKNYLSQQAMSAEIQKILKANLANAQLIVDNLDGARALFKTELREKLEYVNKELQSKFFDNTLSFNISDINADIVNINFSKHEKNPEEWKHLGIYFEWGYDQNLYIYFWLGVVGYDKYFDKTKQGFPFPNLEGKENFENDHDYWLWWETIQYNDLEEIISTRNIERIAKAIEEYAPLCDDIDKNFRKTA